MLCVVCCVLCAVCCVLCVVCCVLCAVCYVCVVCVLCCVCVCVCVWACCCHTAEVLAPSALPSNTRMDGKFRRQADQHQSDDSHLPHRRSCRTAPSSPPAWTTPQARSATAPALQKHLPCIEMGSSDDKFTPDRLTATPHLGIHPMHTIRTCLFGCAKKRHLLWMRQALGSRRHFKRITALSSRTVGSARGPTRQMPTARATPTGTGIAVYSSARGVVDPSMPAPGSAAWGSVHAFYNCSHVTSTHLV